MPVTAVSRRAAGLLPHPYLDLLLQSHDALVGLEQLLQLAARSPAAPPRAAPRVSAAQAEPTPAMPLAHHDPEFRQVAADGIGQHRALAYQQAHAPDAASVLPAASHSSQAPTVPPAEPSLRRSPRHRGHRLRLLDVWLHIGSRHQFHRMAHPFKPASPLVCPRTGLHPDQTGWSAAKNLSTWLRHKRRRNTQRPLSSLPCT